MDLKRESFRAIIYYNWKRGLTREECFEEMRTVLGEVSPSYATIKLWYNDFIHGRSSLEDEPRSGRIPTATTDEMVEKVRLIVEDDPGVTKGQIMEQLKIGSGSVLEILHNKLKMHWVCHRIVPHFLTQEQKQHRVDICRQNLDMIRKGGNRSLSTIITGDETYVHFYDTPTHREAKIWIYEDDTPPDIVKKERTVRKLCYAVFFRSTGLVAAVKLEGQKTVTAKWYSEVCLPRVFEKVSNDRPNTGLRNIILHHDNARPHSAGVTAQYLKDMKVRIMPHPLQPRHCPLRFLAVQRIEKISKGAEISHRRRARLSGFHFLR